MNLSKIGVVTLYTTLGWLSLGAALSAQEEQPTSRQEVWLQQRQAKQKALEESPDPYVIGSAESRFLWLEKKKFPQNIFVKGFNGIRPVIGGMPAGSGFVGGLGYIRGLDSEYVQLQANARYSTRTYEMLDGEILFPSPAAGRRVELSLRGSYRDLKSLRFFGIGNDSSVDNRSTYRLRDKNVRTALWLNPRGLLSIGAEGGWMELETDPATSGRSLETVFAPGQVPGFGARRTQFGIYGGWAEFDLREKSTQPAPGIVGRATVHRYEDTGLSEFDFTRVIGDVAAYIPLGYRNRMLALRARTSHSTADEGNDVLFYLMETLGGSQTIRGFREFRFRDTRNLLLQVEYRWEIWTYADLVFFGDFGKVFSDEDDFNFDGLHSGYGFGVRVHSPTGMTFRIDLARSSEGFKLHFGGGPSF